MFKPVDTYELPEWVIAYNRQEALSLLDTIPNHIAMAHTDLKFYVIKTIPKVFPAMYCSVLFINNDFSVGQTCWYSDFKYSIPASIYSTLERELEFMINLKRRSDSYILPPGFVENPYVTLQRKWASKNIETIKRFIEIESGGEKK